MMIQFLTVHLKIQAQCLVLETGLGWPQIVGKKNTTMVEVKKYLLDKHVSLTDFLTSKRANNIRQYTLVTQTHILIHAHKHSLHTTKRPHARSHLPAVWGIFLSVAGSEGERHPCHKRLSWVLRVRGRVWGKWRVRGVRAVCGECRECGVWGDGWMSGVRTIGQRRCVDVVVVHHRARQHQLEQTGNTNTQKDENGRSTKAKTKPKSQELNL